MNSKKNSSVFAHPLIWGPAVLGLLVAVFVPVNVFTTYTHAKAYYEYVKYFLPMIERHAQFSDFPNVARLYFSVVWPLLPLQIIMVCIRYIRCCENQVVARFISDVARLKITNSISLPLKVWAPFAFVALLVGGIWALFYLGKDPSFCQGCVNTNRFGMALIHSVLVPWAFGLLFAVGLIWFRNIRAIYFRYQI